MKVGHDGLIHMSGRGVHVPAGCAMWFEGEMFWKCNANSPILLQLIMCGPAKTENRSCQIRSKCGLLNAQQAKYRPTVSATPEKGNALC